MVVSKKLSNAVEQVLEGKLSYFEFMELFEYVEKSEMLDLFLREFNFIFDMVCETHYDPFYREYREKEYTGYNPDYFYIIECANTYFNDLFYNKNKNENLDLLIDLSEATATEKIIYLHKLGVIEFLRTKQPFSTSVNSLAIILSSLTGEKSGTIQPMINPMLSKKVDDRNNPLNSKKAVSKVEQQLIKIGFNLNETF